MGPAECGWTVKRILAGLHGWVGGEADTGQCVSGCAFVVTNPPRNGPIYATAQIPAGEQKTAQTPHECGMKKTL